MIQKKEFVFRLLPYIRDQREILFFDETSTHLWDKPLRVWRPIDKRASFHTHLPDSRGKGITVMGFISSKHDRVVYQLMDKTNKECVTEFL